MDTEKFHLALDSWVSNSLLCERVYDIIRLCTLGGEIPKIAFSGSIRLHLKAVAFLQERRMFLKTAKCNNS